MDQEAKSPQRNWQSPQTDQILSAVIRAVVFFACVHLAPCAEATRFVAYFPIAAGETTTAIPAELTPLPIQADCMSSELANAWKSYTDAWSDHHAAPSDQARRRRLGLASGDTSSKSSVTLSSGRSMAATMRLPILEMQRYDTDHFTMLSDALPDRAIEVVSHLERFYHVWTQLFFPLWKERERWDRTQSASSPRNLIKHRIVLFANAARYQQILAAEGPAVLKSTGFYSDLRRIAFFHDGNRDDSATRAHELTHQLMSEATDARPRFRPGDRRDFWLVEGIACYMESILFDKHHATIGGWQASRLSFARHRVLSFGDDLPLAMMQGEGRAVVQQRQDLSRWYSFAAAYTHRSVDADDGAGLLNLLNRLAAIYQIRLLPLNACDREFDKDPINSYLHISDRELSPVNVDQLTELCLSHTSVTSEGLQRIVPQSALKWLDLAFLPIGNEDVIQLSPASTTLEQLNLEATRIDDTIGPWLTGASRLRELDLSNTRISDETLSMLSNTAPIETLWLTGSLVSDASIDQITTMKKLQRVDLQRTKVSQAGVARLQSARPDLKVNPLEMAPQ